MKRLAAVCVVFLIVAAGCGGENRFKNQPFRPQAGDIKLPALPARGLVINKGSGVELIGLDLRYYGALSGLHLSCSGFACSVPLDSSRPRLDRKGKSYLLDATDGYLLREKRDRSDLGHGFEYRSVSIWKMTEADKRVAALGDPNDEAEGRLEIYRGGKPFFYPGGGVVLTREADFLTVSSPGSFSHPLGTARLIDLRNGSIEPLPAGCIVYGRRAGVLNALCTGSPRRDAKGTSHGLPPLSLRRKDGKRWSVIYTWPQVEGEWLGGVLSPDERHLVVTRSIPCDTETVEIVDAQGPKRKVLGIGTALGWSAAGRAIVYLWDRAKPGCDASNSLSGAVYAVDPITLKRTLIVRTSAAKFWDKSAQA